MVRTYAVLLWTNISGLGPNRHIYLQQVFFRGFKQIYKKDCDLAFVVRTQLDGVICM